MQEQQSPHNMFSVYSVRNPLINKRSLLLSYVPHLCIGHRCVNYWNAVFFFLLLRDRLRELAVTRFLLYVRKKKSFKLEGTLEIIRLMLVKANDWATARVDQPNQSKRKEHLQPTHFLPPLGFPVIILVQSLATDQNITQRKQCLGNNEQERCDVVFLLQLI